MKKLLIATTVAASTISMTINAESKFEGFSVELGGASVDYTSQQANITPPGIATFQVREISGREGFADIGIKYTFAVSPQIHVAISYERLLGDAVIGGIFGVDGTDVELNVELDNLQAFIVAPSYALSEQTLTSIRIGYIENNFILQETNANPNTFTFDQKGYSLGFGAQHFITDNIYVGGSFDIAFYDDKSYTASDGTTFDLDTDATKLRLNVGYNF
jgi:opacity protein-like surface antigen